jgi:hypothetical protein
MLRITQDRRHFLSAAVGSLAAARLAMAGAAGMFTGKYSHCILNG